MECSAYGKQTPMGLGSNPSPSRGLYPDWEGNQILLISYPPATGNENYDGLTFVLRELIILYGVKDISYNYKINVTKVRVGPRSR